MTAPLPTPPAQMLAIDPGQHTGLAWFLNGRLTKTSTLAEPTWPAQFTALYDILAEHPYPFTVVMEDYRSQMTMTLSGYQTIQVIGFITGLCHIAGFTLVKQLPPARKTYLRTAAKMVRALGQHPTPHQIDAAAHGLAYLARLAMSPALPLHPTVPAQTKES